MINSAYKLMSSLLKLAGSDDDEIWIDFENKRFVKVRDASEPIISVPFPKREPSVYGLVKLLYEEDFISSHNPDLEYFSLTYKAFYYNQFRKEDYRNTFKKSVLIPFFVAVFGNIAVEIFKTTAPLVLQLFLQWLQR